MSYLWLPIGLAPSILTGWLLLRLVEGSTPVLHQWERWIAGFVLGGIVTTFFIFLTEITGIGSFSFVSMLVTQCIILIILGGIYRKNSRNHVTSYELRVTNAPWKAWQKVLTVILSIWIVAKLISGFIFLIGPAYFDDTISNWNIRGKAFFVQQELVLELEPGKGTGIGSYPQAIPLQKTWLAHLNGEWHEGLVNSMHMLWYLAALALVFFALRRLMNQQWSLLGTYLLASIPLYTMHGSAAYGDCFLSVVIFLAVSWLFFGVRSDGDERMPFLRLSAIASGLLVFTKSEAMLLHLPPLVVLMLGAVMFGAFTSLQKRSTILWYVCSIGWVLIPWIVFKWMNDLGFGNAKDVSGMTLEWHPGVLEAIKINTLLEGNWSLLPVLFVGLLILQWRTAFRTSVIVCSGFFLMVWLGQLPIYMFTALHVEALNQTGYARGIIHLIPVVVFVSTVLLEKVISDE